MVSARTLQAVVKTASTRRSYPDLVAAAIYADMYLHSLIYAGKPPGSVRLRAGYTGSEDFERRKRHAFDTAINAPIDADIAVGSISCNKKNWFIGIAM